MDDNRKRPFVRNEEQIADVIQWIVEAAIEFGHAKCFGIVRDDSTQLAWSYCDKSQVEYAVSSATRKLCHNAEELVRRMALLAASPAQPRTKSDEPDVDAMAADMNAKASKLEAQAARLRMVANAIVSASKLAASEARHGDAS